jgi:hypothetical protein
MKRIFAYIEIYTTLFLRITGGAISLMVALSLIIQLGFAGFLGGRVLMAPTWYEAAPGLHAAGILHTLSGGDTRILATRIDPHRWLIRVADRHTGLPAGGITADKLCPATGAAINASFFNMRDQTPIGLHIIDGKKRYPIYEKEGMYGGWGALVVRENVPSITTALKEIPKDADYVVQCGPPLVIHGTIPPFKNLQAARRSAVGIDTTGCVVFAVSDRSITFDQWARILRDQLDCVNALNLDGGPSAQLTVKGTYTAIVPGGWTAPVFLTAESMPLPFHSGAATRTMRENF